MAQFYSDPTREDDPRALPDAEAFYSQARTCEVCGDVELADRATGSFPPDVTECLQCGDDGPREIVGGYWAWYVQPGALPDEDPRGPFETREKAIEAIREEV